MPFGFYGERDFGAEIGSCGNRRFFTFAVKLNQTVYCKSDVYSP